MVIDATATRQTPVSISASRRANNPGTGYSRAASGTRDLAGGRKVVAMWKHIPEAIYGWGVRGWHDELLWLADARCRFVRTDVIRNI